MRILVVTSQFPIAGEPTRGRPIHQTLTELSRLATVRVLSPVARYPRWARPRSYLFRAPDAGQSASGCDAVHVTYLALPMLSRPFNGWLCGRALRAEARAFAPDVILSYWLYPDASGARRVARELGVPLIAGARGSDIRVRDAISRRLTATVVRSADRLLVVSADLGRLAVTDYGADPARVRVIPNGCDAATFHLQDRAQARALLDVAPDTRLVLYVGRLVAEKGLRELVAAMRALRGSHPGAELVMVGDGPLREEFAAAANDPLNRLRLAGAQPAGTVASWMAACDLLALPSYSEGHPNVLVEALACGRPVVSTPVGGVPEVVDESCAILVPPRDSSALADALARMLGRSWDENLLSRRFSRSWAEVAGETLTACNEALSMHRSGSQE
ncbi:MAG: glycosyltransferase [Dokdonella sp.]|uniref:glycosyltransferase n=1 Tax=Dokdonella sp. TaxID=2291710 RepID=UPI003BB1FF0D